MKQAGKTPPFRDSRDEPVPGSIAEVRYLRIGGIDQWALIEANALPIHPGCCGTAVRV